MFQKGNGLNALVEMTDANMASAALQALDNQEIFSGCCLLNVSYSRLTNVTIKQDSDRGR
jgi:hypothetical protein